MNQIWCFHRKAQVLWIFQPSGPTLPSDSVVDGASLVHAAEAGLARIMTSSAVKYWTVAGAGELGHAQYGMLPLGNHNNILKQLNTVILNVEI